jgi:photosystem II stability/assembly factor-like uncharacterized protein
MNLQGYRRLANSRRAGPRHVRPPRPLPRLALLTVLAPLALLAGCGGGGTPEPDTPAPAAVAGLRCSGPKSTGWCWQAPQPWAPRIDDVLFIDSHNGWAVGDALLRTTDGGAIWQDQALPGGAALRAVRFANAKDGWLLARQGGQLWRTRDGGQTWAAGAALPLDHATGMALTGSTGLLVNGLKAEAGGEPITLLSNDAALTWRTSARFVYPEFAETDGTLWGLADGYFARSVDGGRSFVLPAGWEGPPYFTPVVTGPGSATAWLSAWDYPTQQFGKKALQRHESGGPWVPVDLPPAPGEAALVQLALFDTGGWALTGGGYKLTGEGDPAAMQLWRREAGGGATAPWTSVPLPAMAGLYGGHGFVDGRTTWVQTADQSPRLTVDGGRSWVDGFPPSADATDPLQFVRRDGSGALLAGYGGDGYLTGAERWYRSTDEGRSWRALPGTGASGDAITGLWVFDASRGLAATSGGRWLDTLNAGRDWAARPDAARLPGSSQDLHFTPDGTGWVVALQKQPVPLFGPAPSPAGPLYRSTDQGRSWSAVALPAPAVGSVLGVQFVDDRHGVLRAATGCTSIRFHTCFEQSWATSDGGANWQPVGPERAQGGLLLMRSATQGVLIGPISPRFPDRHAFTTGDGGATWGPAVPLPGGDTLMPRRLFALGDRVWLVGNDVSAGVNSSQGVLLSSGDGGRSWMRQTLAQPADVLPAGLGYEPVLNDIAFADARNGWIVGRQGLVLATTDGGTTWARQASGSRQDLQTLRATSAQTAWIGGTARSILATASGGR